MKMPFELDTLQKREKVSEIKLLEDKVLKYVQKCEIAKQDRITKQPTLKLNPMEQLLMLEIFVYAKDSFKGKQIDLF